MTRHCCIQCARTLPALPGYCGENTLVEPSVCSPFTNLRQARHPPTPPNFSHASLTHPGRAPTKRLSACPLCWFSCALRRFAIWKLCARSGSSSLTAAHTSILRHRGCAGTRVFVGGSSACILCNACRVQSWCARVVMANDYGRGSFEIQSSTRHSQRGPAQKAEPLTV